jgi:serine/threonine-protein kinase
VAITLDGFKPEERNVEMGPRGSTEWTIALQQLHVARKAPPKLPADRPAPAARQPPGRITLNTTPWTEVYFNNRKLGITPIVDIVLPAGTQRLTLVNTAKGIRKQVEVEIEPGKTLTQKLNL